MGKKISVIIKEPGKKARHVNISPNLKNLQKTVGGYIETVRIATDACFICNEEGRILNLPFNFRFSNIDFVGTIIFAGVNGEKFSDVPITFLKAKELFPEMFKV